MKATETARSRSATTVTAVADVGAKGAVSGPAAAVVESTMMPADVGSSVVVLDTAAIVKQEHGPPPEQQPAHGGNDIQEWPEAHAPRGGGVSSSTDGSLHDRRLFRNDDHTKHKPGTKQGLSRGPHEWTAAHDREINRLRWAGFSWAEIAESFGCRRGKVYERYRNYSVYVDTPKKRWTKPEERLLVASSSTQTAAGSRSAKGSGAAQTP